MGDIVRAPVWMFHLPASCGVGVECVRVSVRRTKGLIANVACHGDRRLLRKATLPRPASLLAFTLLSASGSQRAITANS